jgi:hypothetical protein
MEAHHEVKDFEGSRKDYEKTIKTMTKEVERQNPDLKQSHEWRQYKDWMSGGGPFYRPDGETENLVQYGIKNVVRNVVSGNMNVFGGNLIEMGKVPVLYGGGSVKHLGTVMSNGFKLLPEIKEAGGGGDFVDFLSELPNPETDKKGFIQSLKKINETGVNAIQQATMLFDAPMKNWAYLAGSEKGGHELGMKAIQDVSFHSRLADPMFSSMSQNTRLANQLMGYSINTIKMYGGMWGKVLGKGIPPEDRVKALGSIAMYHTIMGLGAAMINAAEGKDFAQSFGLGAAQVPILFQAAYLMSPEVKEWADENGGLGTNMVGAANFGAGFVGVSIFQNQFKKQGTLVKKAVEAMQDGDEEAAISALTKSLVVSQSFLPNVLGTRAGQNTTNWLLDYMGGEADESLITAVTGFGKED